MSGRYYPVHICCNDPDDGSMGRHAYGITLPFSAMCDLSLGGADVTFRDLDTKPHTIRLSRREYSYKRMTPWVGNWCWNAYYFEPVVAVRLAHDLMRDERWQCEGGLTEACEAWERKDLPGFMRLWRRELWPVPRVQIVGAEG